MENKSKWYNNSERRRYLKSIGLLKRKAYLVNSNFAEYFKLIIENIKKGKELQEQYLELINKHEFERLSKRESEIIKELKNDGKSQEYIDTYIDNWQTSVTFNRKDYIKKLDENRKNTKSRSYQNRMRKK